MNNKQTSSKKTMKKKIASFDIPSFITIIAGSLKNASCFQCECCGNNEKKSKMINEEKAKRILSVQFSANASIPDEILYHYWYEKNWKDKKICKTCFLSGISQFSSTLDDAKDVECYSINYKGNVEVHDTAPITVETELSYKDKDEAKLVIQCMAFLNNKNVIRYVEYKYETKKDGNYIYKVWSCKGTAFRR